MKASLWTICLGALILFLWDGAWQTIPHIGVRAVVEHQQPEDRMLAAQGIGMRYLKTEAHVALMAIRSADHYSPGRFLTIEAFSAFMVSFFLFHALGSQTSSPGRRARTAAIMALAAALAVHVPYWNWWGFSASYTVGVILKLVGGWGLVGAIQGWLLTRLNRSAQIG
jgi:hypothetical protein